MRKRNLSLQTTSEVFDTGKHREVIVEFSPAQPDLLILRLKGTRRSYPVPAASLYRFALAGAVEAQIRERKKARADARKGKSSR